MITIGVSATPVWAAAPANDELAAAIPVSAGDHVTADTTEATTDAGDAALNEGCGAPVTKASVWYTYTPAQDTGLALDATASSYSAAFMVFAGTPSASSVIACGPGRMGGIVAHAGETYTVMVFDDDGDGDPANGGNLVLDVSETGPLPSLDVAIDPRATVDRSGTAWITGTYTCHNLDGTELDVELREDVGRFSVYGYGYLTDETPCDGTTQTFDIPVTAESGKFAGGKAAAVVFSYACGNSVCNDTYTERDIQLTRGH